MLDFELFRRGFRYFSVYAWLLKQHFRFCRWPFLSHQVLAAGSRIATIAGLVACVHLLAHLIAAVEHPGNHTLHIGAGLEISDSTYRVIAVIIPVALLTAAALLHRFGTALFGRVFRVMSAKLVEDYCNRISAPGGSQTELTGAKYSLLCLTLVRVEMRFLNIVHNLILLGAVIVGSMLVVGPVMAIGILIVLGTFSGLFILLRQKQAHELQDKLKDAAQNRSAILTSLIRPPSPDIPAVDVAAQRAELVKLSYEPVFLNIAFREHSRVAVLFVQAALVAVLLVYVASLNAIQPGHLAHLVSLFVIMRFLFGTVQSINGLALTMTPDYPALVRIMEGRDFADTPAAVDASDDSFDERDQEA